MEHLQIAYELLVIMIGFAALAISISWVVRTGEANLRNFCILYALFTALMVVTVVRKYLSLNVAGYSAGTWYRISAVSLVFNAAVIVATIHFLLAAYHIRARRPLMLASALTMVLALGAAFSPVGAVLDAERKTIHFGVGYEIEEAWYILSFTFAVVLGWGWLHRIWHTDRRAFTIGLLIFATVGYIESLNSLLRVARVPEATMTEQTGFLVSSIPYALYGIFVILFLLRYFVPASVEIDPLFEAFLGKYGITGREREIILKVVQGKSNADIARELVVSLATVKTHLHNIYGKIGVTSRYDLLARVRSGQ
jgi:DNA-binding CsgD family transcriptional regulator